MTSPTQSFSLLKLDFVGRVAVDSRYSKVTVRVGGRGFIETIDLSGCRSDREQQITQLFLRAIQTISYETSVKAEAFLKGKK